MSEVARLSRVCAELLEQARDLVLKLDGERFAAPAPGGGSGVGAHLRHCLEFFGSLLAGLGSGAVDYDHRPREARLETDPLAALDRIDALREALAERVAREPDAPLRVRADEPELPPDRGFVRSSLARELRALASHTVHHFAIVALLLRAQGIEVEARFGVAPSTWAWTRGARRVRRDH